jgi:hypothetical protein
MDNLYFLSSHNLKQLESEEYIEKRLQNSWPRFDAAIGKELWNAVDPIAHGPLRLAEMVAHKVYLVPSQAQGLGKLTD